uniref:Uncharacterized protein n=1 Tax=Zea mays TaxID=4577 RepID=A0A804NK06_MAIZE
MGNPGTSANPDVRHRLSPHLSLRFPSARAAYAAQRPSFSVSRRRIRTALATNFAAATATVSNHPRARQPCIPHPPVPSPSPRQWPRWRRSHTIPTRHGRR